MHELTERLFNSVCGDDLVEFRAALEAVTARNDISINATHEYGETVLDWAVAKGHTIMSRELIDAGAAIDVVNKNGSTLLHAIASSPSLEVYSNQFVEFVQEVILPVVDLQAVNDDGYTASKLAEASANSSIGAMFAAFATDAEGAAAEGLGAAAAVVDDGFGGAAGGRDDEVEASGALFHHADE